MAVDDGIDHALRSHYERAVRQGVHPADMPVQDWPMTYDGARAVLRQVRADGRRQRQGGKPPRTKQQGGNSFEQPRDRDYPLPPLEPSYSQMLFDDAAAQAGYHPFPRPSRERVARVYQS